MAYSTADMGKFLIKPKIVPPLDKDFRPASLANRAYQQAAEESREGVKVALAFEREDGLVERIDAMVFPPGHEDYNANFPHVERLTKAGLWAWGAHNIIFGGPSDIGSYLQQVYSLDGGRAFDANLMGEDVYEMPFTVSLTTAKNVPKTKESAVPLGKHLDGRRIGIDLGASDRKSAAVIDGEVVFSTEISWDPKTQTEPSYHRDGIRDSIAKAAEHLSHEVDAIGVSSAGIYINNKLRVASLFRGVQNTHGLGCVRGLFTEIGEEYDVPIIVVNDGTVTALAGSMAIKNARGVFGLAMGSSVAGGVTNQDGSITSRLDEFAFVPIDYNPNAPEDDWSKDIGCAVQYLSQQSIPRLIRAAGLGIDTKKLKEAEQLEELQKIMGRGKEGESEFEKGIEIYETIGTWYGYALPHYFAFYPGSEISHVLVLGRVMSGKGGDIILEQAKRVLAEEFPDVYKTIIFHTSTETEKRHGQAIAAASLPYIDK